MWCVCVCQWVRASPSSAAVPSFISKDNLGPQLLPRLLLSTSERRWTKTDSTDGTQPGPGRETESKRKTDRERGSYEWALLIDQCGTHLSSYICCPSCTVVNVYRYIPSTTLSPTREYSYFSQSRKDRHKEPVCLILNDGVQALGGQIKPSCREAGRRASAADVVVRSQGLLCYRESFTSNIEVCHKGKYILFKIPVLKPNRCVPTFAISMAAVTFNRLTTTIYHAFTHTQQYKTG